MSVDKAMNQLQDWEQEPTKVDKEVARSNRWLNARATRNQSKHNDIRQLMD